MTRDEHIAAAEKWLAEAEQMYDNPGGDDGADVTAAASIGLLHAALAGVSPIIVTMRQQSNPPAHQMHTGPSGWSTESGRAVTVSCVCGWAGVLVRDEKAAKVEYLTHLLDATEPHPSNPAGQGHDGQEAR